MAEKHILIDLNDEKAKFISEVLGNKTCIKILNLIAENEDSEEGDNLTETDISKKLKIPLNTIDYNIKKLTKAGLIEKSSHFWSTRGKKMPVYKISNKKIIISPKSTNKNTKKTMIKSLILSVIITGLAAIGIRLIESSKNGIGKLTSNDAVLSSSNEIARFAINESASATGEIGGSISFFANLSPWSWFLLGAWFAIVLFFIINLILEKRNERRNNKNKA